MNKSRTPRNARPTPARANKQNAATAHALSQFDVAKFNACLAAHQRGEVEFAEAGYRALLALYPNHADSQHLLGLIEMQRGDLAEAERLVGAAWRANPQSAVYCNNYGEILRKQKRLEPAKRLFLAAIEIAPGYADAHNNLGNVALDEEALETAEAHYLKALTLAPGSARTWYNLGTVRHKLKRMVLAQADLQKSLTLDAHSPNTWNNLGLVQQELKEFVTAEQSYRQALAIEPEHADAQANLGFVLMTYRKEYTQAMALLQLAHQRRPDHAMIALTLATLFGTLGDVERCQTLIDRLPLAKLDATALSNVLFMSNYATHLSDAGLVGRYQQWDQVFGHPKDLASSGLDGQRPPMLWRPGARRLRLGYLSPDFKNHAAQYFIGPVLASHNSQTFEVFAYSNVLKPDSVTERFKTLVPHWRDVSDLTDAEIAALIRADGIDVLVDTAGHTADNRLQVFGYRPAPVQVTWLGYGYTTGMSAMDYFIGDDHFTPPGSEPLFSESIYRLHRPSITYRPPLAPDLTASPWQRTGVLTVGSLSRLIRINEQTIAVWVAIVKRIGQSGPTRLYLDQPGLEDPVIAATVRQRFAQHGLPPEQLVLGFKRPYWQAYQNELDIALDPFPHNAGTTTMEALWMGLPVVSLRGRPSLGCFGAMFLPAIGHPEWLADSVAQYIDIAVALAANRAGLAQWRTELRASMQASTLMDEAGLTQAMEAAFVDMCQQAAGKVLSVVGKNMQNMAPAPVVIAQAAIDFASLPEPRHDAAWWAAEVEALLKTGQALPALALSQEFLQIFPHDHRALLGLGLALRQLNRLPEAIASYRQALVLEPGFLPTLMNLGRALYLNGDYAQAVQVIRQTLAQAPHLAEVHSQLSYALFHLDRFAEAEAAARQAIALDARYIEAWQNLGNVLRSLDRHHEAQRAFEQTIALNPRHIDGYLCLGSIHKDYADVDTALTVYEAGLKQVTSTAHIIWGNYFFVLNYAADLPAAAIAQRYFDWGSRLAAEVGPGTVFTPEPQAADRLIRVGVMSADFKAHVVRYFVYPWLETIDRSRFKFVLYNNSKKADDHTLKFQGLADAWRDIAYLSDEQVYQLVLQDRIDILVDLSGHSAGHRLNVFARRAAPVQCTWIGTGYTTGLTNMDYFFADDRFMPEGAEAVCSEKMFRFPFVPFVYQPEFPDRAVSSLPALKNGYVTFGCLSRSVRLNHKVVSVWAQILRRLPTARLRLDHPQMLLPELRERLLQQFAAQGVAPGQLQLLATRPHWDAYDAIDIALDPFPHNAGTTTLEALWMGVPLVTLAERPPLGRFGAMFLHAVDLDEWVAHNQQMYVDLAVAKAADLTSLVRLRAELRRRVETSVLLDGANFSAHLQSALTLMWQHHCTGKPAQHVRLSPLAKPATWVRERAREATLALKAGQFGLAAHLFKQIVLYNPSEHTAWLNLGACFKYRLDNAQAIDCFKQAVAAQPGYVAGWYNLGVALQDTRQYQEAELAYQRVLALDPKHDQALNNLGVICKEASRGPEAYDYFQRALAVAPDKTNYLNNLGNLLEQADKLFTAKRVLQKSLGLDAHNPATLINLAIVYRKLAMFDEAMDAHERSGQSLVAGNPQARVINHPLLFTVNYHPDFSAEKIFAIYQRECLALNQLPRRIHAQRGKKNHLTVGLVGGDFRGHAAGKFLMPVIAHHDPQRIRLIAFANQLREDEVSKTMQGSLQWVNISGLDDAGFCDAVQSHGVDILIDVAGWTVGNRLEAMATKPAPVQASWMGYGYTTGLTAIDWFIGDPRFTPPGCDSLFAEKIYRLPQLALCYQSAADLPAVTALPALTSGCISFGHLGRPVRLNRRVIATWAAVLRALPTSRLVLDNQPFEELETVQYFTDLFVTQGVRPEQLVLRYSRPHWDSFADIDICLDPFPHNAGTTTVESLLMGVPVLTLRDRVPLGRFGDQILHAVGLDDWGADSEVDYVRQACSWSQRLKELSELRSGLRSRLLESPLCDGVAFANDFTDAMFDMWSHTKEDGK